MKNNTTELVFILDRSGSMAGLESDTIGGFNSMIRKQKKIPGRCYVSTVLFSDRSVVVHDRVRLNEVPLMTAHDYTVGGMTALMDAVGNAIRHIGNVHKYARKEDRPDKTMFVIITDGAENASRRYDRAQIKALIERQKAQYDWEFLFLGANIDAEETARHYGIAPNRAVNYHADEIGTKEVYAEFENILSLFRTSGRVDDNWNERINADYEARK